MLRTTFASLAMLALACAEGSAGSSSTASDTSGFVPSGSIVIRAEGQGGGASFTATEVRGVNARVSQRSDGSWGGIFYSSGSSVPIDATFSGGQLLGANIRITIERKGGQTTISGTFHDKIVRFEVTADQIRVRTPSRSNDFPKLAAPGEYAGVTLVGEAQQAPPTPAFALAMLGAFI